MPSAIFPARPNAKSKLKPAQADTVAVAVSGTGTKTPDVIKRTSNAVSVALGKSLKAFRIARDLSQEQLAGEAELDRTYVSLIERGLTNPTILTLSTICFCLKISLSELLEPVKENLKPSWADPDAVRRRQNQASPDRIEKRTRLR